MNATWKVILATLVIYSAGLITGALLVRQSGPLREPRRAPPGEQASIQPWFVQQRFLERMRGELELTPEQMARLERVFADSRERLRLITDLVRPEMQAELRHTREKIAAELTPSQRRQFDALMRARQNRAGEPGPRRRDPPPPRPGTFSDQSKPR